MVKLKWDCFYSASRACGNRYRQQHGILALLTSCDFRPGFELVVWCGSGTPQVCAATLDHFKPPEYQTPRKHSGHVNASVCIDGNTPACKIQTKFLTGLTNMSIQLRSVGRAAINKLAAVIAAIRVSPRVSDGESKSALHFLDGWRTRRTDVYPSKRPAMSTLSGLHHTSNDLQDRVEPWQVHVSRRGLCWSVSTTFIHVTKQQYQVT